MKDVIEKSGRPHEARKRTKQSKKIAGKKELPHRPL
jgi:hypothetical protein